MPKQIKSSQKVSEKNTKQEILDAYQTLLEQATDETKEDDTVKQEQVTIDSAAKETVEKITNDLSQLRLTANQTISNLTERLTNEAERFATLQKAITLAQKELEEIRKIKVQAGLLQKMVEIQQNEENHFEQEMTSQKTSWAEELKAYEERIKKDRIREEDEYEYQKTLRMKRDKDLWEEEKRTWERDLLEKKEIQAKKDLELEELRRKVTLFPQELDKAIKAAIAQTMAQERKEAQIHQNFAKQEQDTKNQIAALKITALETTVKSQSTEIDDLKRKLEQATQQVKDIAVTVIEGTKKEKEIENQIRSSQNQPSK